jgi:Mg2+ and Co2+ transporter CorA
MNSAVELLDVITASHLPVTESLEMHRADIEAKLNKHFQSTTDRSDQMANELATLLVSEGVVLSDEDSVREVIAEYLHLLADESASLADDEKNFLDGFLS